MPQIIEIDGSYLEAGGQIIRTAVGLSALTGKPCRIFDIRAGRPKPGLMAQHLTGVQAIAQLCDAKVEGATLWSKALTFEPGKIKSGEFQFDIGTAGSISLVLQSLMVPAIVAPDPLIFDIKGGTDVAWSPSIIYFQNVLSYWLGKMGAELKTEVLKYGFYPAGGGHVRVEVAPTKSLQPLNLSERGKPKHIRALSIASEQLKKARVAERQLEAGVSILTALPDFKGAYDNEPEGRAIRKEVLYVPTLSPSSSLQLYSEFENCRLGAGAIGERGKRAEQVGEEAAELLKRQLESNACIDRWAADQLLPFVAVATERGQSELSVAEITNHCLTNIWVIEKFLPVKFEVIGKKGEAGIIKCGKK
jgi:RNA 3'-phosphate cyclase